MATNQTNVLARLIPQVKHLMVRLVFGVGRTSSRLILLAIFLGMLCYLSYRHAWQPLTRPTDLPPGVTDSALHINPELLQRIITQRGNRLQAPRQNFAPAASLLIVSPRPTPVP